MGMREAFEAWIRRHRAALWATWAVAGAGVVAALVAGPDYYLLRGSAPLPRPWAILFFLSLWSWVALRFIALWIWAWVVMALAPVCLFVPLQYHLDAWWLTPLLRGIVGVSALTVAIVVGWEWRKRRMGASSPVADA